MRSFKVLLSHRWIYTKPGQCHLKKNWKSRWINIKKRWRPQHSSSGPS
jgi:hypothetical protein